MWTLSDEVETMLLTLSRLGTRQPVRRFMPQYIVDADRCVYVEAVCSDAARYLGQKQIQFPTGGNPKRTIATVLRSYSKDTSEMDPT